MRVYFSSPGNQLQSHLVCGLPVLLSFANRRASWDEGGYAESFGRLLIDSGAFSELNGAVVDLEEYKEWAARYPWADAVAGLDDIGGDFRRSLANYSRFPESFPTFHDSDPQDGSFLDELVAMAHERGGWIGVGLVPPRANRRAFLLRTFERLSDENLHVHGWALGRYLDVPGFHSWDSTAAWRSWSNIRAKLPWLTVAESLDLTVKKYQRLARSSSRRSYGEHESDLFPA